MDERHGKTKSNEHWKRYYEMRGIPANSDEYALPSSMIADSQHGRKEEYEHKAAILDSQLSEAVWPLIKQGKRPLRLRVRNLAAKTLGADIFHQEEDLWYWAISYIFSGW
jgi:hypothetical protein